MVSRVFNLSQNLFNLSQISSSDWFLRIVLSQEISFSGAYTFLTCFANQNFCLFETPFDCDPSFSRFGHSCAGAGEFLFSPLPGRRWFVTQHGDV
jgi:hypothetical protein